MAFQTTISLDQGFGVPGDFYDDSPRRVQPFVLDSADAAYNIFGRGFSKTTVEGVAAAGNTGTLPFAGILVNSKAAVTAGTTAGALAPTLTLANNVVAELCTEGSVVVSLPASAALGDFVLYNNTTGALTTIAPTAAITAGTSPAYAFVDRFIPTTSGLAVITLTPSMTYVTA